MKLLKISAKILVFISFIASLLVFSCQITNYENSQISKKNNIKYEFKNKIEGYADVIDGDSIKIDDKNIRLLFIDAPEYKQKCFKSNNEQYNCGILSKKYLQNLIKNKKVSCYYNFRDIYNRFLAVCYLNNININHNLLKEGMAIIYDLSKVNDEIIAIEQQAKLEKRGIWQGYFQMPKEYRKMKKK